MRKIIPYKKLKELMEASRNGNEKAKIIIDKYMGDSPDMDSIDRLMTDYYGNAGIETLSKVEDPEVIAEEVEEPTTDGSTDIMGEPEPEMPVEEVDLSAKELAPEPIDIAGDLDKELEGLIDEDEIDDLSFNDYLKNKKRDGLRAKKNAEYFKAFDPAGREKYIADKEGSYGSRFDGNRRKIERGYNDMDEAISRYGIIVTDMPEDDVELDLSKVATAYDELTGDENTMGAFGRSWDDTDLKAVRVALASLVSQYGKKNVTAVLNTLRDDNCGWRDFCNGKIDNAVGNYGKSLEKLLK